MRSAIPSSLAKRWPLGLGFAICGSIAALVWRSQGAFADPPREVPAAPSATTPGAPVPVPAAPSGASGVQTTPSAPTAPNGVTAPNGATVPQAAQPSAVPGTPPTAPAVVQPPSPPVVPTTARIEFQTIPAMDAQVRWGKTRLGVIAPRKPLVIIRPRDSGPLDVVVTAEGMLPVHTRAHTFADSKVMVKLTPLDQQQTLLGYRTPIDAGVPLGGEGGGPPLAPIPPVPATSFDPNGMPKLP